MLTAKEAKKIADTVDKSTLSWILVDIRNRASGGFYFIEIPLCLTNDDCLQLYSDLKKLGFTVYFLDNFLPEKPDQKYLTTFTIRWNEIEC